MKQHSAIMSRDTRCFIRQALAEDIGPQDVTAEALFSRREQACASIILKQDHAILAGLPVAQCVFKEVDQRLKMTWLQKEGALLCRGTEVLRVQGALLSILKAERCVLNFLQRLSGVATLTYHYVKALASSKVKLFDTRKTIPGWRVLDKYAVKIGGGHNHRMGLYDGVLLKENHLDVARKKRSLFEIVQHVRMRYGPTMCIEIEVDSCAMALAAAKTDVDMILFDNFTPKNIRRAIGKISNRKIKFEASGSISLKNIAAYGNSGVHRISVGSLTHSPKAVDYSLILCDRVASKSNRVKGKVISDEK